MVEYINIHDHTREADLPRNVSQQASEAVDSLGVDRVVDTFGDTQSHDLGRGGDLYYFYAVFY